MLQRTRTRKPVEVPSLTNRYQDVQENQVNFPGKLLVNMEYGNKIETIERTDLAQ